MQQGRCRVELTRRLQESDVDCFVYYYFFFLTDAVDFTYVAVTNKRLRGQALQEHSWHVDSFGWLFFLKGNF